MFGTFCLCSRSRYVFVMTVSMYRDFSLMGPVVPVCKANSWSPHLFSQDRR